MRHTSTAAINGALDAQLDLDQLLAAIPDVAFVTDGDGRIERANRHAVEKLEFDAHEFIGQRIADLRMSGKSVPCLIDGPTGSVSHYRRKQGGPFTARLATMALAVGPGRARKLTVLGEVAADAQFAHVIHALYDISSSHALSSEDKIRRILELGCRVFGLPTGIVSMIDGARYAIVQAYSTEFDLYPGTEFVLGDTYCSHTLKAEGPTCFHRASEQGLATHPCFKKMGLEGYIGVPLTVEGELFGTINFSGLAARPPFRGTDLEFAKLFAAWVAQELGFTKAVAALQQLAETDPLTGCYNRRAFEQRARDIMISHRQTRSPATLVLIDLDNFKDVNDRLGHAAGDAVLQTLAETCGQSFRASDPVGRIGGDEFAVMLDGAGTEDAKAVIDKFQSLIRANRVSGPDGPFGYTATCGLAALGPGTACLKSWFGRADAALYEAKRAGRDTSRACATEETFSRTPRQSSKE